MDPRIIFLTALVTFALAAAAYYRAWPYTSAAAGVAYWAQCVWLGAVLVRPDMPLIFWLVVLIGVGLPVLALVLFAIDVWFGAFTADMTYGLAVTWLLSPLAVIVPLLAYALGGPTA